MGEHHLPRAVRVIPGYTGRLGQIIRDQGKPRDPPQAITTDAQADRAIRRLTRWMAREPVQIGERLTKGGGRKRQITPIFAQPPRHIVENAELARHWNSARTR